MKKLAILLMVAGLFSGRAFSGEDGTKEAKKTEKQNVGSVEKGEIKRPDRSSLPSRSGRGSVDPQQRFQEMLSRQAEIHKKEIDELVEIKKIAEEENATRTAEAIQKVIDKKDAEYKKKIEQATLQQKKRAEQIRERMDKQKMKQPQKVNTEESTTKEEPVE
jgi:hypothetical protein